MYQFGEQLLVYNVNVCILRIINDVSLSFDSLKIPTNIYIEAYFMSQEEKLPKILIVEDDERLARLTQNT